MWAALATLVLLTVGGLAVERRRRRRRPTDPVSDGDV
jgi:hypothetical protein